MEPIRSISRFLQEAQIAFTVFDLGRRISALTPQQFRRFEDSQTPYPMPVQRQAWMGLLGQPREDDAEHFVWFLRFPLDENGILQPAARDGFLARLLDTTLGGLDAAMKDSPYGFKPREDRMAAFHAIVSRRLGHPPSQFYEAARTYLAGDTAFAGWENLGIQGLADIAARLDEHGNNQRLAKATAQLPAEPLAALCGCLENVQPNDTLSDALRRRLDDTLADKDAGLAAALVRGLSHSRDAQRRDDAVQAILASGIANDPQVLAAIAGRAWEALREGQLRHAYLEALALNTAGQEAFNAIMADVLYMPGMREPLLQELRAENRSDALVLATGGLFSSL